MSRVTRPSDGGDPESAAARPAPLSKKIRTSVWPVALGLMSVALLSTLLNAPGVFIGDNTFQFFWRPASLLHQDLFAWNQVQGTGHLRIEFWPVTLGYVAILRSIGFSPALAERAWHATLLAVGGIGLVQLIRVFRPRIGIDHIVAALLYMFGPWTAVLLIPSNLFLYYALAPWFLLAITKGIREQRPWRWAAVFALLIFATGNSNYPSLLYALFPAVPMALYLIYVSRSVTWAATVRWVARAVFLTVLVSAAALVTARFSSTSVLENLSATEGARVITTDSSWAESWRGLGFWLAYYGDSRGLVLPQLGVYFWFWPVILATFAAPLAAVATVAWSRWRPRLAFAAIMLSGVVLMVGAYPFSSPSPYGRTVLAAYDHLQYAAALRNTIKALPVLMIGVAVLAGAAAAAVVVWVRRWRPRFVPLTVAAAIAAVLVISVPFWSNHLYPPSNRTSGIPRYWDNAISWLNRQPDDGRVLVLPSTNGAKHRWGYFADDLGGLVNRPVITRENLQFYEGSADAANLIAAMDEYVNAGIYRPGVLAPIARRLGIRYILIRNDLDWQALHRPRPATFDTIRADPGLRLRHTFGAPGENVTARRDQSPEVRRERRLPPVEIYEPYSPAGQAVANAEPPLLVAGDGSAWPQLAQSGVLDAAGPVQYTARLSSGAMADALRRGGKLVITDTNQRRTIGAPIFDAPAQQSLVLSPGDKPPGGVPPADLFHRPGSQSVAESPVTTRVTASGYGTLYAPPEVWLRPANAFDGDLSTAWRSDGPNTVAGAWIRAELRRPASVSSIELTAAPGPSPIVTRASVHFSSGAAVLVDLSASRTVVAHFAPRVTKWIEVRVEKVEYPRRTTDLALLGAPGFSEIRVPGVDLRQFIQTPDDVFRAARRAPELSQLVRTAPVQYQFSGLGKRGFFGEEAEPVLLRRFETLGTRSFDVSGTLRVTSETPGSLVDALDAGRARGASSGTRSPCTGVVVHVDGQPVAVRVDDPATLRQGGPTTFASCSPITLNSGWHILDTVAGLATDSARLVSQSAASAPVRRASVRLLSRDPDRVEVSVRTPGRTGVVVGPSYQSSWRATLDGRSLGPATELDTLSGWWIPHRGTFRLVADQRNHGLYVAALVITGIGVVLCLALAVWRPRRRSR